MKKALDDIVRGIVFSFFIASLWNMQITWAGIKSHKCSKFGQSGLFTLELPALIAEKNISDLGILNLFLVVALCAVLGILNLSAR